MTNTDEAVTHVDEVHAAGFHRPKTVTQLRRFLHAALEVEHLTIPVYMTGMYTIRPGTNRTAYYTIRSVLLEEMLHMTLVANLLNAVGGTPRVAHSRFVRSYPATLPMSDASLRPIHLRHFSPEALQTFLTIERPRSFHTNVSEGSGWTSIGQFYAAINEGLTELVREHGEDGVFTGDPARQVGPEDFYNSGGEVFPITGLDSAQTALEVISEQGEGAHDSIWDRDDQLFGEVRQLGHFFRFNEIHTGRHYGPNDAPSLPPSGPLLDVSWDDAYPIVGDSTVADYHRFQESSAVHAKAVEFNAAYATLLCCLERAFRGLPRALALAIPTMLTLRDLSEQLYRNPHPNPEFARDGYFASATFEITPHLVREAQKRVDQHIDEAGLETGEPVDLSGVTVGA